MQLQGPAQLSRLKALNGISSFDLARSEKVSATTFPRLTPLSHRLPRLALQTPPSNGPKSSSTSHSARSSLSSGDRVGPESCVLRRSPRCAVAQARGDGYHQITSFAKSHLQKATGITVCDCTTITTTTAAVIIRPGPSHSQARPVTSLSRTRPLRPRRRPEMRTFHDTIRLHLGRDPTVSDTLQYLRSGLDTLTSRSRQTDTFSAITAGTLGSAVSWLLEREEQRNGQDQLQVQGAIVVRGNAEAQQQVEPAVVARERPQAEPREEKEQDADDGEKDDKNGGAGVAAAAELQPRLKQSPPQASQPGSSAEASSEPDPFAFLDEDPVNIGDPVPRFEGRIASPSKFYPDYGRPHPDVYIQASKATGRWVYMGVDFTDAFDPRTFPVLFMHQRILGLQEFLGSVIEHTQASGEELLHIRQLHQKISDLMRFSNQHRRNELWDVRRDGIEQIPIGAPPEERAKELTIHKLCTLASTNERKYLAFLWDAPIKYLAPRVYSAQETTDLFENLGLDPQAVLIRACDAHRWRSNLSLPCLNRTVFDPRTEWRDLAKRISVAIAEPGTPRHDSHSSRIEDSESSGKAESSASLNRIGATSSPFAAASLSQKRHRPRDEPEVQQSASTSKKRKT